jgi:hypothetical protein
MLSIRKMAETTAVLAAMVVPSWAQSKLVEDPFPGVDCRAYDTGEHFKDKHSQACRSFVQLAKAKDTMLPLHVGPVYACFGIGDELFVIDTAMDQAKSDKKEWAAYAEPSFAFYRSGIESGLMNLSPPLMMDGKWNLGLSSAGIVSYSGTTDNEMVKEMEHANPGLKVPRVTLSIDEEQIAFGDFTIQSATGRFTYWTDALSLGKNIQLPAQCAIFKMDFKMETPPKANIQHMFWKQVN